MDAVALSLLSSYVILKRRKQQAKRKRIYYIWSPHGSRFALQYGTEIFERYYRSDDPKDLRSFCRLSPRQFDELLELVDSPRNTTKQVRGRGDDEGSEITAVLDLMKAQVEKPSFAYIHTIAKNVDDVMDKLENLGLEKDKKQESCSYGI